MKIQPIDDFVFAGFQQRLQQQFDCETLYVTASDKTRVAQRLRDGKPLEYPYITVFPQSIDQDNESYSSNFMGKTGLVAIIDDNTKQAHKVRLIPTVFEFEVIYTTNAFKGSDKNNVLFFIRRWLLARRNGWLSFTINYGRLRASIQAVGASNVPFTQRENSTDTTTEYQVVTSATVHGYVSEPELGTVGIVNTVALLEAEGLSGGQYFPFDRG